MDSAAAEMTVDRIRARLAELDTADQEHTARDLDAELQQIIRACGDVDALEDAQLEAERLARRRRVERRALEAELPDAVRREGAAELVLLKDEHIELAAEARAAAKTLAEAWGAFDAASADWQRVQRQAQSVTERALALAGVTGAAMPPLGTFKSALVTLVAAGRNQRSDQIDRELASADWGMQTASGIQATWIDGGSV